MAVAESVGELDAAMECQELDEGEKSSSESLEMDEGSDFSVGTDSDNDFKTLREDSLKVLGETDETSWENNLPQPDEVGEASSSRGTSKNDDPFPRDFAKMYKQLFEPKQVGGVVSILDSDTYDDSDNEIAKEPKCMVPLCSSRRKVKQRSRLVTSFYGLSYIDSPLVCHRCFSKAAKFYKKISRITPSKLKLLVNDNVIKPDCIDICDDGPVRPGCSKMLEEDGLAKDICKNISSYVEQVAIECNVKEKFKQSMTKMESRIGEMTIWINELSCKLDMDDVDMVSQLQKFYSSFDHPLEKAGCMDLDIVDADNPEVGKDWQQGEFPAMNEDQLEKSTIVIDGYSDPDIAIVEDTSEESRKKPSSLPPRGQIVRKKPSVGQKVFVSRQGDHVDWLPAIVETILIHETQNKKLSYTYKVRISVSPTLVYTKEVTEEQMAYYEPSPVRIAVGNRVISALHPKTCDSPLKYYSGIIAESPCSSNNYRYMIFFDSMAVQYSEHNDVRVTCNKKESYLEYFPHAHHSFVRRYFDTLPKRKILSVNTMDTVKVEFKGNWVDATVTAVDSLLMEVYFKKGVPTEWIYRGSPRVMSKDMYRAKILHTVLTESDNKRVSRGGVVAEDDPAVVEEVKRMIATKKVTMVQKLQATSGSASDSSLSLVRAVARKTITRLCEPQTAAVTPTPHRSINHSRSNKDEFAGFIKREMVSDAQFPKDMGEHDCNETCISWTNRTLDTCRGRNPLIIPMLLAFRRIDVCPMGEGARQIFYKSPCGRQLLDFDQLLSYLQKTKCQLSVDYFNFDPWVNVYNEFKASPEGLLLKDLSYGKEFNPIAVVNTVDIDLPPYMEYMVMRKATDGVPLNLDPQFLSGCDCKDDCSNKSNCPCWQKTIKDYLDLIVTSNTEIDSNTNIMDYSNIGYQNKRLVEYVSSGIYECNSTCKCSHTCLNRVVQLPLKLKLELFKTKHKGWGTRCLNDIPAGGFICVYVGNILTEKAANEGGKRYGDEYFAELDYIEVMERLMNKPDYESGLSDPENKDDNDRMSSSSGEHDDNEDNSISSNMKLRGAKKGEGKNKSRVKRSTNKQQQQGATQQDKKGSTETSGNGGTVAVISEVHTLAQPGGSDNETKLTAAAADTGKQDSSSHPPYIPLRALYANNESVYIIDAKSAGNIGRYFNHSCEPNIFVQNVFVDTHDLRFPWVAFFAKHHIRSGTELTWDYQYIVDSVPGKRLYCYCRSRNCRGRLL